MKLKSGDDWKFTTADGVAHLSALGEDKFILDMNEFGPADGSAMDFTIAAHDVPIVSATLKDALFFVDGLYYYAVAIPEKPSASPHYYAMATDNFIDCFDERKSVFSIFTPDDPVRPDRAGDYHSVIKLIIDPAKAVGHDIFRIKRYPTALIVSERVKITLERGGFTGLDFRLCTE
ncbi:hypothetical protein CU100_04580 [Phyllobacterium endophyticum]|uniref:Immunity MXAN-0049 protein domain-containing protein n=2 Tax=Phyllobacterium endophyticum TaxID=1149773 RepID=A0A2P7B0M4_9HYPH|nr:hypothetical protein CU100_04580 [Phyllobacterium endophyticum]